MSAEDVTSNAFTVAVGTGQGGGGGCAAGSACTSAANSCGLTNSGTCNASGVCSAVPPSDSACTLANATLTAAPSTVNAGGTSVLTWGWTGGVPDTCAFLGTPGVSTGNAITGSVTTPAINANMIYQVQCFKGGVGGQVATAEVSINVPLANITADPTTVPKGGATTLNWNTDNVTTCSITKETELNGVQSFLNNITLPSGSASSGALASTTIFAINCTGGTATGSANVFVLPTFGE